MVLKALSGGSLSVTNNPTVGSCAETAARLGTVLCRMSKRQGASRPGNSCHGFTGRLAPCRYYGETRFDGGVSRDSSHTFAAESVNQISRTTGDWTVPHVKAERREPSGEFVSQTHRRACALPLLCHQVLREVGAQSLCRRRTADAKAEQTRRMQI